MNGPQHNQIIAIEDHQQSITTHLNPNADLAMRNSGVPDGNTIKNEVDISDIFRIISRRKKLILLITFIALLLSYLYTASLTPTYRAVASIKIDLDADKLAHFDNVLTEKKADYYSYHQTQFDLLKSRKLARRVINKLDLEDVFEKQAKKRANSFFASTSRSIADTFSQITQTLGSLLHDPAASEENSAATNKLGKPPIEDELSSNLTITRAKQSTYYRSNVITLEYDSFDPELAASILNTLIEEYVNMNLEGMSESSSYAKKYLTEQIALAKARLEKSEEDLVKYAKEKKIIKTDSKNSLVSQSLDVLNQAYTQAQKELIEAESEYRQRNKVSGDIRMLDNTVIQDLKKRRSELETKYKQQLQIYKPAFPAMIELKKQINETQQQIKNELNNIRRKSQNDLQSKFYAAREKVDMLGKKLELKKAELLAQRDKSIGYGTLQREVETNRQMYDNLLQRMKEVGIAGGVVSNNVSIVDPAIIPYKKYSPNTVHNLAVGSLLGLIFGLIAAFLRDRFDDRLRTVDELEGFNNLPVLGVFPLVKKKQKPDTAVLVEDRHSVEAEAFRSLVTNLGYIDSKGLPKVLHITSAAPSEGKSNTAINTAMVIAESKKSVLLIDADLRKPKVDQYLKTSNKKGLSDFLVGKLEIEDVIIDTSQKGLSLITAGLPVPSPSQLLSDDRMLELLEYAATEYDHVIIDSPPVLGLADALILANRSNATLFVVASGETRRSHLADALKRLKLGYANVIGYVLTKAKSSKSDYYSYDSYYGYRSSAESIKLVYKED